MNETISIQEIRKDPVNFLRRLQQGNKLTVIYHSKPLTTVMSVTNEPTPTNKQRIAQMLEAAEQAQASGSGCLADVDLKQQYYHDEAQKHGVL